MKISIDSLKLSVAHLCWNLLEKKIEFRKFQLKVTTLLQRERQRDRETERQTERDRERDRVSCSKSQVDKTHSFIIRSSENLAPHSHEKSQKNWGPENEKILLVLIQDSKGVKEPKYFILFSLEFKFYEWNFITSLYVQCILEENKTRIDLTYPETSVFK
jgi:hypothetical protein